MGAVSPPANPNILPPLLKPDVNTCKNECKYKQLEMQKNKTHITYIHMHITHIYENWVHKQMLEQISGTNVSRLEAKM